LASSEKDRKPHDDLQRQEQSNIGMRRAAALAPYADPMGSYAPVISRALHDLEQSRWLIEGNDSIQPNSTDSSVTDSSQVCPITDHVRIRQKENPQITQTKKQHPIRWVVRTQRLASPKSAML